jgi:hypothetical protein
VTPAAAATAEPAATTLPRSSLPSQRQPGYQLFPQPHQQLQPWAFLLLCRTLLLLLPAVTSASRRPHHLQLHRSPPARPPTLSTPGNSPLPCYAFLFLSPWLHAKFVSACSG